MKPIFLFLALYMLSSCLNTSMNCDDLLQRYDENIQEIEFIACEKGEGQTVLKAKYKVLSLYWSQTRV